MSLSILVSSVCMPSSGIVGSYDSCLSSFLRNLHTKTIKLLKVSFSSTKVIFSQLSYLNTIRPSLLAQLVKNPSAMKETSVQFLAREDLLEKG